MPIQKWWDFFSFYLMFSFLLLFQNFTQETSLHLILHVSSDSSGCNSLVHKCFQSFTILILFKNSSFVYMLYAFCLNVIFLHCYCVLVWFFAMKYQLWHVEMRERQFPCKELRDFHELSHTARVKRIGNFLGKQNLYFSLLKNLS